jgi:hypothetical protein
MDTGPVLALEPLSTIVGVRQQIHLLSMEMHRERYRVHLGCQFVNLNRSYSSYSSYIRPKRHTATPELRYHHS